MLSSELSSPVEATLDQTTTKRPSGAAATAVWRCTPTISLLACPLDCGVNPSAATGCATSVAAATMIMARASADREARGRMRCTVSSLLGPWFGGASQEGTRNGGGRGHRGQLALRER